MIRQPRSHAEKKIPEIELRAITPGNIGSPCTPSKFVLHAHKNIYAKV